MTIIIWRDEDHDMAGLIVRKKLERVGVAVNISRPLLRTRLSRSVRLVLSLSSFVLLKKMIWFGPVASRTGPAITEPCS
jgi:hypothetical protein